MQLVDGRPRFSASDLVGFLGCEHLTQLDRAKLAGLVTAEKRSDAELELLTRKGDEHEKRYLERLRAEGAVVTEIARGYQGAELAEACRLTEEAMRRGDAYIYQAAFLHGDWIGFADFLKRIDRPAGAPPSALGAWSYEPIDTKLAYALKAGALLQLCVYSDLVTRIQGVEPEYVHVVLGRRGATPERVRLAEISAYYRLVRRRFEAAVLASPPPTAEIAQVAEDPVERCGVCGWAYHCAVRRRATGHLSRVAFIRHDEIVRLRDAGIPTVRALAAAGPRLAIQGIAAQTMERLWDQARLQVAYEDGGRETPEYHILDHDGAGKLGLLGLPAPSPLDVFFDIESDRFAEGADGSDTTDDSTPETGGLEYLFGYIAAETPGAATTPGTDGSPGTATTPVAEPRFTALWSHTWAEEKRTFERFIDDITARRVIDPWMHVYHYAPYEPSAMRRLALRHATREAELDVLLRAGVFVDLYKVVRQGVRVSMESYSIKRLEPFYSLTRQEAGYLATNSMLAYEEWIESRDDELLHQIERYNEDDCRSTVGLRDWLEARRSELLARDGLPDVRPDLRTGEQPDASAEKDEETRALFDGLTADIDPDLRDGSDLGALTDDQRARLLLGHLLWWHKREASTEWVDFFVRCRQGHEELLGDPKALGGLAHLGEEGTDARSTLHRFAYDREQDHPFGEGDTVYDPRLTTELGKPVSTGSVFELDAAAGQIVLKRSDRTPEELPTSLVGIDLVTTDVLRTAIGRVAERAIRSGIDRPGAIEDILLCRLPRIVGHEPGRPIAPSDTDQTAGAVRVAARLEDSYLAIQGPPGTGKTYTGAQIARDLVARRRKVGITSNSHAAITNLLAEVVDQAKRGPRVSIIQKVTDKAEVGEAPEGVERATKNEEVLRALQSGEAEVAAGTAWLWARADMQDSVDTLIVDEAGQLSLANLVAVSGAARNLILLGDPQQLAQVTRAAHPAGADASALGQVIGDRETIDDSRGILLETTYRLHPSICDYTSSLYYDGRLRSKPGLERQAVRAADGLSGSGLRHIPIEHEGNDVESPEEAEAILAAVRHLLGSDWVDEHGRSASIEPADMLVVAPYNAQVGCLRRLLPEGVAVGTVDKFQGQQAPVVFYSMATSTPADMPRDMTFLFSRNRLNVATSRAKAMAVVVCSPALLAVRCRTPEQMRLANGLARFIEMAAEGQTRPGPPAPVGINGGSS